MVFKNKLGAISLSLAYLVRLFFVVMFIVLLVFFVSHFISVFSGMGVVSVFFFAVFLLILAAGVVGLILRLYY